MLKTRTIVIAAMILVAAESAIWILVAASRQPAQPTEKKLSVVASFYPLTYLASEIGGSKATVINITPAGAEPHDYEPTAQDAARIEDADMLILNGGGLESWGDNSRQNFKTKTLVIASEGLTTQKIEEGVETIADPHVWLSPQLMEQMIDKVIVGYVQADPENTEYYKGNAAAVRASLADLDEEFRQGLAVCNKKDIITSHAAFGYLASAYGLRQVPISGLSPDAEPSPQQLAQVAAFAKTNKVKYIFFESLVSPKLSETIAAEVGAKTLVLNPIEGLREDELNQGKNYLTEMRNNLKNLQIALECLP